MADRVPVAMEHVQHRPLESLGRFSVVVTVVGVGGCGKEAQPTPAALLGKRQQAWQGRLRDHDEIDVLSGVLGSAVELVQQRGTRGARASSNGRSAVLPNA